MPTVTARADCSHGVLALGGWVLLVCNHQALSQLVSEKDSSGPIVFYKELQAPIV